MMGPATCQSDRGIQYQWRIGGTRKTHETAQSIADITGTGASATIGYFVRSALDTRPPGLLYNHPNQYQFFDALMQQAECAAASDVI